MESETNNIKGWNGDMDSLPGDTIVGVKMSEMREPTLNQMMQYLGERGIAIMIRYDPLRDDRNYTICVGSERLCDTDSPMTELRRYIREQHKLWTKDNDPWWVR